MFPWPSWPSWWPLWGKRKDVERLTEMTYDLNSEGVSQRTRLYMQERELRKLWEEVKRVSDKLDRHLAKPELREFKWETKR